MAKETLTIEAIIEGADSEALKQMSSELDNLSASTAKHGAQSRTAAASTDVLDRSLNRTWETAKGVAAGFGLVFSAQAVVGFVSSSVQAFGEYEQAMQRVVSASGILGENEDLARFKIAATTDELQKRTTFGNERQMEALNALILSTQDYERAMSALPITLDVAAAHGLDAATAGRMVGMALEGNTFMIGRYVPALRGLSEEEKNAANISRILEQTYKGRAEAMAQTTTGQLQIMRNEWGDLKRTVGGFLLFMAGDFTRGAKDIIEDLNLIGEGIKLAEGKGIEAGLAALPFQRGPRRQEELQVSPMFRGPIPQAMHELDVMRQMSPLAYQRWKLEQEITAEIQKGSAKYEDVITKSLKMLDIQKEEKKIRQDIAGLIGKREIESLKEVGDFFSALGDVQKKFPSLPAVDLRMGDRFISSRELTGEEQGVSRFSMFQEEMLQEQLTRKDLPKEMRADIAGQVFQQNLAQLGQATTPEMTGRQLEESVMAFNDLQTEKAAQLSEEVAERRALIDNTALTNQELLQIRGVLERIAGSVTVNPRGFETMKRNELE